MAENMCFRAQYETWVAPPDLLRQHLKSLDTASEQEERGGDMKPKKVDIQKLGKKMKVTTKTSAAGRT